MTKEEWIAFDMYFASIAAMQFHPGAGTKGVEKLTLEQCRKEALKMIRLRREINFNEE